MKLITELYEEITAQINESEDSRKDVYIEGVYAQAIIKNRNGRIYPKPILEKQVTVYEENYVSKNRAVGELNHPQSMSINPDRIAHKIVVLEWKNDSDLWGKSKLTNTPKGNLVRNLVIDDGIALGVSTRGAGTVKAMAEADVVQNDFYLKCWDIVTDPSAPAAFINGVMENKEWVFVDGILIEQEIEQLQNRVDSMVKKNRFNTASLDKIFKNVIQKL
jgi:hypothetical protein